MSPAAIESADGQHSPGGRDWRPEARNEVSVKLRDDP